MKVVYYIGCLLIGCCLMAWTPWSVDRAQAVVAQADSLWATGQAMNDSLALAQAYRTLRLWRTCYPDEYVHACYHYGKLLRAQDDPAAAMQVFIHATHSRSNDYHILGRVYSNMGDLCHLAEEFPLAYDMYERSGEMYLRNGDTLLYYYDLNNMAFELAEQGRKEETLVLLSQIDLRCSDKDVLAKVQETKAEIYKKTSQYDSTIYCIDCMEKYTSLNSLDYIIKAQAFSKLGLSDSAILYAKIVLSDSLAPYQHKFNALYIISHRDSSLNKENIRDIASQREDIRYYEYEPQMEKLKDAVRLLQQTLTYKPNLAWLYTLLGTIVAGAALISWYVSRKRKKHELLSQQIDDLETDYADLRNSRTIQIERVCATLRSSESLPDDLKWKNFNQLCIFVNEHFYLLASKLQHKNILNETEIRLCILVLIGLSRSEIADILPYALNSVGKLKDHTAKKLGTTGKNLRDFLIKIVVDE